MMYLDVKRASVWDANDIVKCNMECLPICYSLQEYIYYTLSSSYELLVGLINDKVVAYVMGWYEDKNFHVASFGVSKQYRRKGIGTILLTHLEKLVKKYCKTVSLNVHVENIKAFCLYKKSGYVEKELLKDYYKGSIPNAQNFDGYLMVKTI